MLPLLTRIAPMLESYMGARGGSRAGAESAITQIHERLTADSTQTTQRFTMLGKALAEQTNQLEMLAEEVRQLVLSDSLQRSQLKRMEAELSSRMSGLRLALIVLVTLLLVCAGLLIALLVRR